MYDTPWSSAWNGPGTGAARAFTSTMFPDPANCAGWSPWCQSAVRARRYAIYNEFADGTAYLGRFGSMLRQGLGLYKDVRSEVNPVARVLAFMVDHLMAGPLDPEAGPGGSTPSALPIIPGKGALPGLPAAVAALWAASLWDQRREIYTSNGVLKGDSLLEIQADMDARLVRMVPRNPEEVTDCWHVNGKLLAITLERQEIDPRDRQGQQLVRYKESITLADDGASVTYETFLDDAPYIWPGTVGASPGVRLPAWRVDIPFIPMVLVQHINRGYPWGISEVAAALQTVVAIDSQLSNLGDAKMREVNGPWLLAGATLPDENAATAAGGMAGASGWDDFNDRFDQITMGGSLGPGGSIVPAPGGSFAAPASPYRSVTQRVGERSVVNWLQTDNPAAKATPLIYGVNVGDGKALLDIYDQGLKGLYPELQLLDRTTAAGAASGRALRVYQQPVARKVLQRRGAYDAGLVQAQRMALALGGHYGFPDYEGFTIESYADGTADHRIGEREVFPSDPLDVTEIKAARADVVQKWVINGAPLRVAMIEAGIPEPDIDNYMVMMKAEAESKAQEEEERVQRMVDEAMKSADAGADGPGESDPAADPGSLIDQDKVNENGADAGGQA